MKRALITGWRRTDFFYVYKTTKQRLFHLHKPALAAGFQPSLQNDSILLKQKYESQCFSLSPLHSPVIGTTCQSSRKRRERKGWVRLQENIGKEDSKDKCLKGLYIMDVPNKQKMISQNNGAKWEYTLNSRFILSQCSNKIYNPNAKNCKSSTTVYIFITLFYFTDIFPLIQAFCTSYVHCIVESWWFYRIFAHPINIFQHLVDLHDKPSEECDHSYPQMRSNLLIARAAGLIISWEYSINDIINFAFWELVQWSNVVMLWTSRWMFLRCGRRWKLAVVMRKLTGCIIGSSGVAWATDSIFTTVYYVTLFIPSNWCFSLLWGHVSSLLIVKGLLSPRQAN